MGEIKRDPWVEVDGSYLTMTRMQEEIDRLKQELDIACRMLAKRCYRGPWNLTNEDFVKMGRKMAGLKDE